jgi:predicted ATPase
MYCTTRDEDALENVTKITVKISSQNLSKKMTNLEIKGDVSESIRQGLEREVDIEDQNYEDFYEKIEKENIVGCNFSHHFLPSSLLIRFDAFKEKASFIVNFLIGEYSRHPFSYQQALARRKGNPIIPPETIDFLDDKLKLSNSDYAIGEDFSKRNLFDLPSDYSINITVLQWVELTRSQNNRIWRLLRQKVRTELTQKDLEELNEITYQALIKDEDLSFSIKAQPLPRNIKASVKTLDYFFSTKVKYLGPLRDEPKALYPLAPSVDPSDIGLKGEYTAAVFDRYQKQLITYIPTKSFPDPKENNPLLKSEKAVRTLKTAVLDWLSYLQIAEDLNTKDMGKLGHELKVKLTESDKEQDLMHVGVGVSQVLPILVVCLLADEDTTLIFEQPELHLHPFVQTRLADFFLSMSLLNRQCIIETHSEYLINRLRFRVASDKTLEPQDSLNQNIKIYFTEKNGGISEYREVAVNKYGAIVDWPKGFFDQSQREAEEILRASMAKRKQEKEAKREQLQQQKKLQEENNDA